MASSLAAQLAQGASLNKSFLVDRSRRRPAESYLFTSREADKHDLDAIHALGANAFLQLKTVEPLLGLYEEALFSDAAKTRDRTLQTADANAELDRTIEAFLTLLGPYILEATTGKVIEWLVRRFRINEFNVEAVLYAFMPYHDAPHFQKMLSILHIKDTSKFAPLLPYKSTTTPLTHNAIVNIMTQPSNSDFARFVGNLLPSVARSTNASHALHRALIAFHTVLFEFVRRTFGSRGAGKSAVVDEGTVTWVLVAASEPLQICTEMEVDPSKQNLVGEVVLSSYLLLSAISHTCTLAPRAFNAVLKAIAASCSRARTPTSPTRSHFQKSVVKTLLHLSDVVAEVQGVFAFVGTERFVNAFGKALVARIDDAHACSVLTALVTSPSLPLATIKELARALIQSHVESAEQEDQSGPAQARSILVHIQQRYPNALQGAFEAALNDEAYGEKKEVLEQLLLSLSVALPTSEVVDADAGLDSVVASMSADGPVRVVAVRQLYEKLASGDVPQAERDPA
ncbi:hypothetical protein NM688_g7742 [Phlebia brevispora]|uniref:Uncharacterized protein n=1 Tax=Phlebia brevispora TaxID=194682 RepID=A0ACC1S1V0_9APHY|nr:hypothetical protein NM688_g7742 [Phlebia brevispora]